MPHPQPVPPCDPYRSGHSRGDLPLPGWAELDELVDGDVVAGDPPVPITVWRPVAVNNSDDFGDAPPAGLTSWLARRLVATYSRPGHMVVDFDNDPPLRHAATAGGRIYLPLSTSGDLADLGTTTPVDLITLRWPRPAAATTSATTTAADLFRACRLVLGRQGHTAVIIAPSRGVPYVEHTHDLVPAARASGMGYLQHIIAVLTPIVGERLLPPGSGVPAGTEPPMLHTRVHLDMLIFVVARQVRRG
jgi:hypothetical protein